VQTVKKRTFGSAHPFFTNFVHPSERLDKGSIPGTRIQSTGGHVAYVCVGSCLGPEVAVLGFKVSETKYHVQMGAFAVLDGGDFCQIRGC
jgi:hypothetical protein